MHKVIDPQESSPDARERTRTLCVRVPPNARFGKTVRDRIVAFAKPFRVARRDLEDFIFAVGEALANAIEHSGSSDVIEVRCRIEPDRLLATIVDSGAGFATDREPSICLPEDFSERGRGLPIMRRCTDIFALHSIPGKGTAVVLGRYLHRGPGKS